MIGVISYRWITASGSYPSRPKAWVARIRGFDHYYGYQREFIKPVYDYSFAAKTGKGTVLYFFLPEGVYEVKAPISWKHEDHYFCRSLDGDIIKLSREDLECALKNGC